MLAHLAQLADLGQLYGPGSIAPKELLVVAAEAPIAFGERGLAFPIGYAVVCLLLTAGIFTRVSALLLLLQHVGLYTAVQQLSYGFDYFCVSALFYCLIFPVDRHGSVDRQLFALRPSRWVTPSLRVLQLHLCIVYFFAGLLKACGPTWHDGEALWKAYQLPAFAGWGHIDITWLGHYPFLWAVLGWLVILLETAYPVAVWMGRIRPYWLLGIITLHAGIAIFMGLYEFSAMMILLNICAFQLPYQSINRTALPALSKPGAGFACVLNKSRN